MKFDSISDIVAGITPRVARGMLSDACATATPRVARGMLLDACATGQNPIVRLNNGDDSVDTSDTVIWRLWKISSVTINLIYAVIAPIVALNLAQK